MTTVSKLMDMHERVVLITGGAGHVGRTAAETYLELGAHVVLLDFPDLLLGAIAEELEDTFQRSVRTVACDLEDEASWRPVLGALAAETGRLDVLVNCAAFVGTSDLAGWAVPLEDQTLLTWRRALEVNVTAPFGVIQALLPALRTSSAGGVVVNVSSIYGLVGPQMAIYEDLDLGNPAAYAVSKAGLLQLTRWMATVLAPDVRVNAIAPGGLLRGQDDRFVQQYQSRTPLQRLGTEGDLKGAFAYLASDLSAYVTGHTLVVDGGWTAW